MAEHKYSLGTVGFGHAVYEYGKIEIIDGRVYSCSTNLADLLAEFQGHYVEIVICSPSPSDPIPMDPHITPLVKALQRRGVTTLSSCDGHLKPNFPIHFPFVAYLWPNYNPLEKPDFMIAKGWRVEQTGTNVWRLRTIREAISENELPQLWATIEDQIAVL